MQNPVTMPSAPQLGTPVPGTTGGLPALSGLSVTQNPMAQQLQSYGRGDDSMLVHMTPDEVNSLQGLAMAAGGSLTINPVTGLPEAGWLGKLLPTILGIAGAAFGIPTWAIGLGVGAGQTALTGDLGKGLTAGLQAFGGAGLGQAAGIGGKLGSVGADLGLTQSATGASSGLTNLASKAGSSAAATVPGEAAMQAAYGVGAPSAGGALAKAPGFLSKFGAETSLGQTGMLGKALPVLAGTSVLGGISDATAPKMPTYKEEEYKSTYVPMGPGKREVRFQTPEQMRESGGAEFQYYTPSNPEPVPLSQRGYAEGGVASIPTEGFNELVEFFGSTNPGAITASMYPTSPSTAAASGGERVYNFARPAPNATANNLGLGDGMGPYGTYGGFNISNLNGLDVNAILENLGYSRQQPTMGGTGANQQPVVPSTPAAATPAPVNPAPVNPAPVNPAPAPAQVFDYGFDFGEIIRNQNAATPPAAPVRPAPSTRPSPSAPPIMMAEPQNSPMPTYVSLEDIMASYTPPPQQPVPSAPEPEFVPARRGRGLEAFSEEMLQQYARGGAVDMRDGSFVVDARTVSEIGNGSSNAGIETLSRMGGRPVRGPGDGVSDSVRASIGGKQEARVARDEVIFSPEAVRRLGGGSDARGTKKLYALMDKAHKARKKAKRGQDTKVRKGLA